MPRLTCPSRLSACFLFAGALGLCLAAPPAGAQDAGALDGGDAAEAGPGPLDAGLLDGGLFFDAGPLLDGGLLDAGFADGGLLDAGLLDGGAVDGGLSPVDAGFGPGDAGPGDAGPDDCAIRCEGDVLLFCDAVSGMPLSVDCGELDARCGLLSASWGFDCLLPEGAECSPGYAEGLSRCDPAGPLFCNDGTCQDTPGEYQPPPIDSNAGGLTTTPSTEQGPLSCLGCEEGSLPFGLAFLLLGLRLRRRLR